CLIGGDQTLVLTVTTAAAQQCEAYDAENQATLFIPAEPDPQQVGDPVSATVLVPADESLCPPDPGTLAIEKYVWDGESWAQTSSFDYHFVADGISDHIFDGPGQLF